MFRAHQLSQTIFRLILTPTRDLEDRIDAGVFYIGLGDQFDDDRRLVRETMSALRDDTSHLGGRFLSSYFRR